MRGDQSIDILQRIAAAYPRFDVTELKVDIWHEHLQHMPYEQVLAKLNQHIATEKFFPSIAEISVKVAEKNNFLDEQTEWRAQVKEEKAAGTHRTFLERLSPELKRKYGSFLGE